MTDLTPSQLRKQIRSGKHTGNTSGYCPGFVQTNMVILPKDWAADFLQFCQKNPKPCPVLGMSDPGSWEIPELAADLDIRSDLPSYKIFENGKVTNEVTDIKDYWRDDLVTFMLGCSFSFEEPLIENGLEVLLVIGVTLLVSHFLGAIITRLVRRLVPKGAFAFESEEVKREDTLIQIIKGFMSILIWIAAVFYILSLLGVPITPLITGAGIIGVAVGFGSQSLVKDVINGI